MGTDAKTADAKTAKEKRELTGKEAIYQGIADFVMEKTESRIGRSGGHVIFDMVVDGIFGLVAKEGSLRFNGGYGSLHVRNYGAGSRKLPSGSQVKFGPRTKVRYEEGVSVKDLLKNGGKTTAAKKDKKIVDLT